jgi:hypothetical protein
VAVGCIGGRADSDGGMKNHPFVEPEDGGMRGQPEKGGAGWRRGKEGKQGEGGARSYIRRGGEEGRRRRMCFTYETQ